MSYVSSKYAQTFYGVSASTLRYWANNGLIEYTTTEKGHRRFKINQDDVTKPRLSYVYCRVSSRKQEEDLERQISFMQEKYPTHIIKADIGSGINHKRQAFRSILEQLFQGNIKEVRVASMDRWSRFGNDMFKWMFARFGARIISEKDESHRSKSEELADDLMEIITVYSARYNGMRKYKGGEDSDTTYTRTETASQ